MLIILFTIFSFSKKNKHENDIKATPDSGVLFFESFDTKDKYDRWITSKLGNYSGTWKIQTPPVPRTDTFERMLVLSSKGIYSAISTIFPKPILVREKPFILQFEVRAFKNFTCSGAYIKLFDNPNFDQNHFSNETKQFLMFGPDFCAEKQYVPFMFYHKNPITQKSVEKSLKDTPKPIKDDKNHLYTLIVRPDGSYSILIDNKKVKSGKFIDSFDPPIVPPKKIPDPSVRKPDNWDDRKLLPDNSVKKPNFESELELIPDKKYLQPPSGWLFSEPPYIEDISAPKPINWDTELLGEWKGPIIPNPKCAKSSGCGQYYPPIISNPNYIGNWEQPMKPNPNYKGEWKPPLIDNPDYFVDDKPFLFPTFYAAGFELISADGDIGFNNILIADNEGEVMKWNSKFWDSRKKHQTNAGKPKPEAPTVKKAPLIHTKKSYARGIYIFLLEGWMKLYAEEPGPTLLLSLGLVVLVVLLTFFCVCQICPSAEIDDDENDEEEDEDNREDEGGNNGKDNGKGK